MGVLFCSLLLFAFSDKNISAHPGNTASDGCHYCRTNCDYWGEVYGERHCHGGGSYDYYPTTPSCPLMSSYNSLSGQCECYSGYVAQNNQCISGNSYCWNKYGYHSRYDSLDETCECSYGYVFNRTGTKCISEDEACQDLFGYGAQATLSSDSCECRYGYVWEGGKCVWDTSDDENLYYFETDQGSYSLESTQTPKPTTKPTIAPIPTSQVRGVTSEASPAPIPKPESSPSTEPTPSPLPEMTAGDVILGLAWGAGGVGATLLGIRWLGRITAPKDQDKG